MRLPDFSKGYCVTSGGGWMWQSDHPADLTLAAEYCNKHCELVTQCRAFYDTREGLRKSHTFTTVGGEMPHERIRRRRKERKEKREAKQEE